MLKTGDKILWDSHFGYDICKFIRYYPEDSLLYYHVEIENRYGKSAVIKTDVFPYTEEKHNELKEKYGY